MGSQPRNSTGRNSSKTVKEEAGVKYEFLKRPPRIFEVGDPEKLGFPLEEEGTGKDKYGVKWFNAIHTIAALIFANENIPTGLEPHWFNGVFYWVESPYMGVRYDVQGYAEFSKLVDEARAGNVDELFKYSPPIKAYIIPPVDTPEREQFTRVVKLWSSLTAQHLKTLRQIREKIEEVESILSERGV